MENSFMKAISKTSEDMWRKGWAERNAGNISLRLDKDDLDGISLNRYDDRWAKLEKPLENLSGEYFIVSGAGKYLKNISNEPEKNVGVIEINQDGTHYRIIWGLSDGGMPTSELPSHLQIHSNRKQIANGESRAIIHAHPPFLIALSYALELDTVSLTKLLWSMHTECIMVFPEGIEYLKFMVPGSEEIAKASAKALSIRNMVLWEMHGIFAVGNDLDTAFGLIDTAEKASEIYAKATAMGGIKRRLSEEQIKMIAVKINKTPAEDIL